MAEIEKNGEALNNAGMREDAAEQQSTSDHDSTQRSAGSYFYDTLEKKIIKKYLFLPIFTDGARSNRNDLPVAIRLSTVSVS